jgi:hypothetical protein
MTDFFVNHTRCHIVRAENDAVFNIAKNLRDACTKHGWSIDDHIEFLNSDAITHPRGCTLLIENRYSLDNWSDNLQFFLNICTKEYREITLSDYCSNVGPFGV